MIDFDIKQVGRRWFVVELLEPIKDSDAHYITGSVEASYVNKYWPRCREWTVTGKGCRKHKAAIVAALERHLDVEEAAHE